MFSGKQKYLLNVFFSFPFKSIIFDKKNLDFERIKSLEIIFYFEIYFCQDLGFNLSQTFMFILNSSVRKKKNKNL